MGTTKELNTAHGRRVGLGYGSGFLEPLLQRRTVLKSGSKKLKSKQGRSYSMACICAFLEPAHNARFGALSREKIFRRVAPRGGFISWKKRLSDIPLPPPRAVVAFLKCRYYFTSTNVSIFGRTRVNLGGICRALEGASFICDFQVPYSLCAW